MGLTKTDLFTDEQNIIAQYAKVLGHPARIAIIQYLLKSKSCINTNLVQELGLAQATISQHLKELKQVGIIQGTIDGTAMNYCINNETWNVFSETFQSFFNKETNESTGKCC